MNLASSHCFPHIDLTVYVTSLTLCRKAVGMLPSLILSLNYLCLPHPDQMKLQFTPQVQPILNDIPPLLSQNDDKNPL